MALPARENGAAYHRDPPRHWGERGGGLFAENLESAAVSGSLGDSDRILMASANTLGDSPGRHGRHGRLQDIGAAIEVHRYLSPASWIQLSHVPLPRAGASRNRVSQPSHRTPGMQ